MNRRQYLRVERFIMYLLSCYLSDQYFELFTDQERTDIANMFSLFRDLDHFPNESDQVFTVEMESFKRLLAGLDSLMYRVFNDQNPVNPPSVKAAEGFGDTLKTFCNPGMVKMIDQAMELSN